jgi:predicted transposase/invertase (TIGR01784 family)
MDKYINPFTDFGFKKIFGEEANLTSERLKYYRDIKNVVDTAVEEAVEIAREEKVIEFIKELSKDNVSIEKIASYTGLRIEEIIELQAKFSS